MTSGGRWANRHLKNGIRTSKGFSNRGSGSREKGSPRSDQVLRNEGHLEEGSRTLGCISMREVGPRDQGPLVKKVRGTSETKWEL